MFYECCHEWHIGQAERVAGIASEQLRSSADSLTMPSNGALAECVANGGVIVVVVDSDTVF